LAERIAATDIPVLLLGETGTGKEVFANAIHKSSKRNRQSFVAINCSAFNKELLESELFGHRAGAYTGAIKDKKGLVEVADKGTLFLDEVGELSADLQAKMLRFLENGEFIKLGDTKVSKANVRIIAATNRDLKEEVSQKQFREDLYYRLNGVSVSLPPLRERIEDLPLLIDHFLREISLKENKQVAQLDPAALYLMQQYKWKGNIRELKNVLARAFLLSDNGVILPEHLPYEIQHPDGSGTASSLAEVEHQHIRKILQHTHGNKTKAAQLLEIGLATLYRKMEQYGISK
jgi:transcriptional regulator with PAS, ATPase and Fis domain